MTKFFVMLEVAIRNTSFVSMAYSKHSYSLLTHTFLTIFYHVSAAFAIKIFYLNGQNGELGEDELFQILSEFSCEKNKDVERFAKNQSVEFAKKQQSVTYLVFSTEDAELASVRFRKFTGITPKKYREKNYEVNNYIESVTNSN